MAASPGSTQVGASERPTRPPAVGTTMAGAPVAIRSAPSSTRILTSDRHLTQEQPGRYVAPIGGDQELGRGGLGRVLVALDRHLGRDVAVKELLPELVDMPDSDEYVERFLREARITGQLEHPNIVPVYELGRRDDGALYYTMRVVRGRTLAEAIRSSANLEERLALVPHFHAVCQAIAYAHSRGVIHRDIKPENVMLGEFGETVVLDWGIAKLRGDHERRPQQQRVKRALYFPSSAPGGPTADGDICGTPHYMSPEQARGRHEDVDEQSDVWALGAMLYVILTGRPPVTGKSLTELLERLEHGRIAPPHELEPRLPADLSAIAARALERDRTRRYASARELAREVAAFQSGLRVGAYEYSSLELLRRFVTKNRAAVLTATVASLALLGLAAVAYERVVLARDRALAAESLARKSADQARHSLVEALVDKAARALQDGDVVGASLLSARALVDEERPDARGLAVTAGNLLPLELTTHLGVNGPALAYGFDVAGRVGFALHDDHLRAFTAERSAQQERWVTRWPVGKARLLVVASAAQRVLVAVGSSVLLIDVATGAITRAIDAGGVVEGLAVSDDGRWIAARLPGAVHVFDRAGARVSSLATPEPVTALAFDGSGDELALGGQLGAVRLWRWASEQPPEIVDRASGTVLSVAFSAGGRYLAVGSWDGALRLWDRARRVAVTSSLRLLSPALTLAWSADGRWLACGTKSRGAELVDVSLLDRAVRVPGEADETHVAFTSDGELLTASRAGGLRVFRWRSDLGRVRLVHRGNVLAATFASDSNLLVTGGVEDGLCLWALDNGVCRTRLPVPATPVRALTLTRDGLWLAVAAGSSVHLWDFENKLPRSVFAHSAEVRALAFAADHRTLVTGATDGSIALYDVEAGERARWSAGAGVQSLVLLGSDRLVTADREGAVTFWSMSERRALRRTQSHEGWAMALAASPDGRRLVSGGAHGHLHYWDVETGQVTQRVVAHDARIHDVVFSPDGRWLASAGEDRVVKWWDASSGALLATLDDHEGTVRALRFSADGRKFASASDDGTVRLWAVELLGRPGRAMLKDVAQAFSAELLDTRVVMKPR